MSFDLRPLGPVAHAYFSDNSRVACIEGPVGSAKSTASCLRLARHALEQHAGPDGIARSRFAIVRNTKRQLEDTTIKTWLQLFPENIYGEFVKQGGGMHTWQVKAESGQRIHAEFMFRALDDEKDVANLLSLEVTGFYFNEVREISESIITHAGRRSGRFPAQAAGGTRWQGWIADTNPWDTEHYLQDRFIDNPRPGWAHFLQPGGMDPDAENIENLPGGRQYYIDALADYSPEDADVYVHAKRGRTRAGKPIYSDYSDRIHCQKFELNPQLPLEIGLDFGRTPAATIGQRNPTGGTAIRRELVATNMGLVKFAEQLKRFLGENFPQFRIGRVTGDPSGVAEDAHDETAFQIFQAAGIHAQPAFTNELSTRIETVNKGFRTLDEGRPSLIIHPDCKVLRRACIDGYMYKKLAVAGNRYADKPDKNAWSHVAEALQYELLGNGAASSVIRGESSRRTIRVIQPTSDFG